LKALALAALCALTLAPAGAQTPAPAHVTLFAAGSLRGAVSEIVRAFSTQTGIAVDPTYGSSGVLREKIEGGAVADVFASADTANPLQLQREGKSGTVAVFTRNRMCLLVKSSVAGTRGVADLLLDPAVRLITSTPKADPAGDYAETIFAKLDVQRPGSRALLDAKALRLIGGSDAVPIPPGADLGTYLLLTGDRGDALLAYCSGFVASVAAEPVRLRSLEMPTGVAVQADYGLAVRPDAPPSAIQLRNFLLGPTTQAIFAKFGFSRV